MKYLRDIYGTEYKESFKYCRSCGVELIKGVETHQSGFNRETGKPNPPMYQNYLECPKRISEGHRNHDRWYTEWYHK